MYDTKKHIIIGLDMITQLKKAFFITLICCSLESISHAFQPSAQCISLLNEGLAKFDKTLTLNQWNQFIQQDGFKECPLSRKFLTYVYFQHPKQKNFDVFQLINFLNKNKHWPQQHILRDVIEQHIEFSPNKAQDIVAWFDKHHPRGGVAIWTYTQALKHLNQNTKLKKIVPMLWRKGSFDKSTDHLFYKTYKNLISKEDNQKRTDYLLWQKNHGAVKRMLPRLGTNQRLLAESRMYLQQKKAGVDWHVKKAHKYFKDNVGFIYDRLVWRREKRKNKDAADLLKTTTVPNAKHSLFWRERHILARRALEDKDYQKAYNLVANHGMHSGASFATAEWLAGWLSLRFLNNPNEASKRFKNLYDNVSTPISRSRAAYWLGRAYENMGEKVKAEHAYSDASRYRTTFYGQLAAQNLGIEPTYYEFKEKKPSQKAVDRVENREFSKLLILLSTAPKAYDWTRFFAINLAAKSKSADEKRYVVQFITKWAPNFAVEAARTLSMKDEVYIQEAYPALQLKGKFQDGVEHPLAWAIIRRESMFNHKAISPAGAMGLMQIMPHMARNTAKKHKIKLNSTDQLIEDPVLNAQLGYLILSDLLKKYNGSYPIVLAAYNAGEKPVDEWLKVFGDPTKGEIEWLDWLELIPYYETRDYVQRVLEQLYIYRLNYPVKNKENPLLLYSHRNPSV